MMERIMKNIFLSIALFGILYANGCYQNYRYIDTHQIKTRFDTKVIDENKTIQANLHVHHLENNESNYTIFWFEDGVIDKEKIDIESIYVPFMVKHTTKDAFVVDEIYTLSKDKTLHQQLLSIIDIMQFDNKIGRHIFKNGSGVVEVNQTLIDRGYSIGLIRQINNSDIVYNDAYSNIILDKNCSIWDSVLSKHNSKLLGFMPNSYLIDRRTLHIDKSPQKLPTNHWFFSLSDDLTKWDIGKKTTTLSLKDALLQFETKHQEMMALINKREEFIQWINNNMDFLAHLDKLLESMKFDNRVSMNLFSKLGLLNSVDSSRILAKVTLNENINETERFRGLMGLKNTSAPLDDAILDDLLDYGLNPNNGEDFLKNATGMLMGALAKERINRSPTQTQRINEELLYAISTHDDKRVVMAAVGNMGDGASDEVVRAIGDVVSTSDDYKARMSSAAAIEKLNRTDLDSKTFQDLINKEQNSDTKAQLIKATVATKDFNSNQELKEEFLELADNSKVIQSNRMASLIALDKSGYGKTPKEKKIIRKMMRGEKNSDIIKILKKIYRK